MKPTPSTGITPKIKLLLFGAPKTGKTLAALSFPRPLLIDAEGGADLHAQREDIAPFDVICTTSLAELTQTVDFAVADKGKTYDTFIIDSMTIFVDVLRAAKAKPDGSLGYRERSHINTLLGGFYPKLHALTAHLVLIAHVAGDYETEGKELKRRGDKASSDTSIAYRVDYAVQMRGDHSGVVVESRGYPARGEVLKTVNWSVFEPATNSADLRNRRVAEAFFARWKQQGLTDTAILDALQVDKLSQWTAGVAAADEAVARALQDEGSHETA